MVQKSCSLVWRNTFSEEGAEKATVSGSETAGAISEVLLKGKELESEVIVVKMPSAVIESDELLKAAVDNISVLNMTGASIIIVHDHSESVERTLDLFGIDKKFYETSKISDHKTSQLVEMVLSGHINKKIVSALCAVGCNAVGISGKDGNMIEAKKHVVKSSSKSGILEFGFISEPSVINPEILINLTEADFVPVIAPVAFGADGSTYLLDVNLTASIVACVTTARHLILMEDPKNPMVSLGEISIDSLRKYVKTTENNSESRGYVEAIASTLQNHAEYVHIVNCMDKDSILSSIFTEGYGTKVYLDS
ncbi:MAG: hypothetical protein KA998_03305 [Rickettsiaceae bacterium]|nr:hypothetical protein [Rickettsiaceae bacterium]